MEIRDEFPPGLYERRDGLPPLELYKSLARRTVAY
jgi:hypothetical protein